MKIIINSIIFCILWVSVCLNVFLIANYQSNCDNIDSRWKADLLYNIGHKNLDGDGDGVACENLPYNQE